MMQKKTRYDKAFKPYDVQYFHLDDNGVLACGLGELHSSLIPTFRVGSELRTSSAFHWLTH
jgi:hypothetical protein